MHEKHKQQARKKKETRQGKAGDDRVRLNRFIALSGICSRREADNIILGGEISVNGNVIRELGTKVDPNDDVRYKGKKLKNEKPVYLLLNKPKGFVTTLSDPHAGKTVLDLVKNACRERVFPVGRLDKESTGLLLLTNDGDLAAKLSHPRYEKKKIYHVWLDRELTKNDMIRIGDGIELDGEVVTPDALAYASETDRSQIGIELHSGRNRVVRKMFESAGYDVRKLDRVYYAGLTKKNLPRGKWRFLTEKEIVMLKRGSSE